MKNELLKALYDCFYTPPELTEPKQEVEQCHQALIEVLGKPERRLVLQIIDAKDRIAEDISIDSFISGFELAWQLSAELNNYKNEYNAGDTVTLTIVRNGQEQKVNVVLKEITKNQQS